MALIGNKLIKPRVVPSEQASVHGSYDEENPPNHPENLLFAFLGMLTASIVGLTLYYSEIQDRIQQRSPANVQNVQTLIKPVPPVTHKPEKLSGDTIHPYQYFPWLY